MTVVLVVIGALGAVSDMFDKHMEKLSTTSRLEVIIIIIISAPVLNTLDTQI